MVFVKSGMEALEVLEKDRFDILITDYKMPGMNGLELLRIAKEKYKDIALIAGAIQAINKTSSKSKIVKETGFDPWVSLGNWEIGR